MPGGRLPQNPQMVKMWNRFVQPDEWKLTASQKQTKSEDAEAFQVSSAIISSPPNLFPIKIEMNKVKEDIVVSQKKQA